LKKILGGCLIVLVIALIGFGVAGYYAYHAMKPMIDNASNYIEKAREVERLGEGIKDKTAFEPPANGELTQIQVERFLAVQTRVRAELDGDWAQIERKSADIRAKADANSKDWTLSEFTSVFSDIANIYLHGRKAQIVALNTQRFSEDEWEWVRRRVYEAAGVELAGNFDLSSIESLARDNAGKNGVTLPKIDLPKVPEKNVALVRPHAGKIKEWMPMAVLGL
jgi:hypothetical protein